MNGVFENIDAAAGKIEPGFWQSNWAWFLLGAILIIAIASAVIARLKRRKQETPLEKALMRIGAASAAQTDSAFALYISSAVREYISDVYKMPAPERTTEEFLKLAANSGVLDDDANQKIAQILTMSDMAKFAAQEFGAQGRSQMANLATRFVEEQDAKINQTKK
ncbi:MAG: hypothetical protein IKS15_03035 [Opitutales bacterium]|nr:hypothetical protein [Opitutales bacterium]